MSSILAHVDELRAGHKVDAECPSCGLLQCWWDDLQGRTCASDRSGQCGHILNLNAGPPTILCSRCGEPLDRMIGLDPPSRFFRCEPCGRDVP